MDFIRKSGIFGLVSVLLSGSPKNYLRYVGYTTVGAVAIIGVLNRRQKRTVNEEHVVVVTGCDSGLGHNIARRCYNLNMTVVAACYDTQSEGALQLAADWDAKRGHIVQLDLRNQASINNVHLAVTEVLNANKNRVLSAVVNNAGVMGFGEFEWQTDDQIVNQLEVNLLGTMRFTHKFLALCRQHKSRIICVTSHCAIQPLPFLAPYSASKSGLDAFVTALRVEMRKYGVDVINFTPGSFTATSGILAGQLAFSNKQRLAFTDEQRQFYGDYFERFQVYLSYISGAQPITVYDAKDGMMQTFEAALLESGPRALYLYEPTRRYKMYQRLLQWAPTDLRDYVVGKFMHLPKFHRKAEIKK